MGSAKSKPKEKEDEDHVGKVFTVLNRVRLPAKGGQGRDPLMYDYAYVEKKYLVCGKMDVECVNSKNNVEKKELLDHLGVNEDMGLQTFYLLCDVAPRGRVRLPDPKFVRNLGTTKWILDANLETALQVQPCHGQII